MHEHYQFSCGTTEVKGLGAYQMLSSSDLFACIGISRKTNNNMERMCC